MGLLSDLQGVESYEIFCSRKVGLLLCCTMFFPNIMEFWVCVQRTLPGNPSKRFCYYEFMKLKNTGFVSNMVNLKICGEIASFYAINQPCSLSFAIALFSNLVKKNWNR